MLERCTAVSLPREPNSDFGSGILWETTSMAEKQAGDVQLREYQPSDPANAEKLNPEKPIVDKLIDVAGEIFAEKGRAATIREICSAAGCSVAAINYYFGDKQNLYLRCVAAAVERKQRLFPLPPESEASNPTEPLRKYILTMASRMTAKSNLSWHNQLMMKEVIEPSPGVREILQSPFKKDFALLLELLGRLVGTELDSVKLRQSLATQIIARLMFLRTGTNLCKLLEVDICDAEDPQAYADSVCDSVLTQIDGLRKKCDLPPLVWSEHRSSASLSDWTAN